jgi:SAM-dependent methyltransferase
MYPMNDINTYTENKRIQVDLGCGPVATPGFIGVDRFILPGVGIAADLNKSLPFADNAVDLLFASHSLEHVENLPFTMSEIYRVCKHGAQVCIVAPYYQQSLNFANPYHKQIFNEHTPRFWTNYHNVPIEKAEYNHPASYLWGLAESDNSIAQIDLRILQMDFFYYPEYQNLSVEQQRIARKKYLDVCDQIVYNLVVVKENIEDAEMVELTRRMKLYEPPYVTHRKLQEQMKRHQEQLQEQMKRHQEQLQEQMKRHQEQMKRHQEQMKKCFHTLADTELVINQIEHEFINIRSEFILHPIRSIDFASKLILKLRGQMKTLSDIYRQSADQAEQAQSQVEPEFIKMKSKVLLIKARSLSIVHELAAMHERRISRLANRFRRVDLLQSLDTTFQQFLNDSYTFQNVKGFLLQPSINLERVNFLSYRLEFNRRGLCGLWIAPLLDIPLEQGTVGIELVSPENRVVLQKTIPVKDFSEGLPEHFVFAPVLETQHGMWEIRIFARDIEGPTRLAEWRKYSWGGLGRLMTRAFFAFDFS